MPTKEDNADPHVSVSFSLPKSVKEKMDERIASLSITRSDYLKWMVLWELDKGPDAEFDMPRRPKRTEHIPDSPEAMDARNRFFHGPPPSKTE